MKPKHYVLSLCALASIHCASTDELPVDARSDAIAVGTAGAPDDAGAGLDAGGSTSTDGAAGARDYDASAHQGSGCDYGR